MNYDYIRKCGLWLCVCLMFISYVHGDNDTRKLGFKKLSGMKYSTSYLVATVGLPIASNIPSFQEGLASRYQITPALPAGLQFNNKTGIISGTPQTGSEIATTLFTVIAFNPVSSTSTNIEIIVVPPQKFLLADANNDFVKIFDVAAPQFVSTIEMAFPVSAAFGNGRFAVACDGGVGVVFIDGTTNEILEVVGEGIELGGDSSTIFLKNRFLITGDEGVLIIDSSSSQNILVAEIPLEEGIQGQAAIVNGFLAVPSFLEDGSGALVIIDPETAEVIDFLDLEEDNGMDTAFGNGILAHTGRFNAFFVDIDDELIAGKRFFLSHDISPQNKENLDFLRKKNDKPRLQNKRNDSDQILFGNNVFVHVKADDFPPRSRVDFFSADGKNIELIGSLVGGGVNHAAFGNNRFAIARKAINVVTIVEAGIDRDGVPFFKELANVPVNIGPNHVTFGGNHFLVTHEFDDRAVLIDAITNKVVANIDGVAMPDLNPFVNAPVCFSFANASSFCITHDEPQAVIVNGNTNGIERQFFFEQRRGMSVKDKQQYRSLKTTFRQQLQNYKHHKTRQLKQEIAITKEKIKEINLHHFQTNTPRQKTTRNRRKLEEKNRRVAFSDDKFFAIDNNQLLIIDAIRNVQLDLRTFPFTLRTVVAGGKRVVVTHNAGATLLDSTNLNELAVVPFSGSSRVVFGNDRFFAVFRGEGKIFGLEGNILQSFVFNDTILTDVAFGGNHFGAHGSHTVLIDATTNNIVFNAQAGNNAISNTIAFGGGKFITATLDTKSKIGIVDIAQQKIVTEFAAIGNPTAFAFGNNRFGTINSIGDTFHTIDATLSINKNIDVGFRPTIAVFGNNRFVIGSGDGSSIDSSINIIDSIRNVRTTTIPFVDAEGDFLSIAFNPGK
ncbi:Ig domain-containing protein [Candidatus Uabimicrobium amorphum]|uniref:Dystroglycan-type cadherin-like domain-containing protein n=1 Tax=Uabimicrobium amorphum TaxID=2596890 RepID=A0A5S9F4V9_UABAM|nr:Ig domain-containing protein [Candidatus Uabimicrobium amorphum]BBM86195.1 hypothetical protein UABAM_04581 [Candidatus Uabimicrobium amorphum]